MGCGTLEAATWEPNRHTRAFVILIRRIMSPYKDDVDKFGEDQKLAEWDLLEIRLKNDEMATVGYDGLIYVVTHERDPDGAGFIVTRTPVGRDSDRFHHLAAGPIRGLGHVLVACGYSGRVIVVDAVER